MRDCKKCKKYLEYSNFYKDYSGRSDGKGGYRSVCKNCLNSIDREKRKNNALHKLKCNIRHNIREGIKRNKFNKNSNTKNILGCSFDELKKHLESKFEPWMTWQNYGLYNGELNYGWDIDHIIPLSSAETQEDIIKLNYYTNLQPLCSKFNRDIKKDNVIKKLFKYE